jgi:hypothetical protein
VNEITKKAIQILLAANTAVFPLSCFANSTNISNLLIVPNNAYIAPVYGSANIDTDSLHTTCFNTTSPTGVTGTPDAVVSPSGSQGQPYSVIMGSGNLFLSTSAPAYWITKSAAQYIPFTGYYSIVLSMTIVQQSADPVYYWTDVYAILPDGTHNVRILYSGDVPYELNGTTGSSFTTTLTGGTFLPAGSTILSPRFWTTDADPLNSSLYPAFCINNTSNLTATLIFAP